MDLVQRLKLIGKYLYPQCDDLQNLAEIGQVVLEILKILVNPGWRLCAILDLVQRLKLMQNISMASVRRSAKFGRNPSSRAGDITGLSIGSKDKAVTSIQLVAAS